ncbi:hypothetical protein GC194_15365 [bacterium]|nr:hypothetical protein [bacterium]
MNYWKQPPTRDEVLDKIYDFLKLLSQNQPDEAEKLVRVGSMSKFRDALHYHMADYVVMIFEDKEFMELPDDFSTAISNPYDMDENDMAPAFSGNQLECVNKETISLRLGLFNEITPIKIEFMIGQLDNQYFLNLMKVSRE